MRLDGATRRYWKDVLVLYRCWDADERLIYIGRTQDMPQRVWEHRRNSWWWSLVAKIRMQVFTDIYELGYAETDAIRTEMPTFNNRFGHGYSDRHYTAADVRHRRRFRAAR